MEFKEFVKHRERMLNSIGRVKGVCSGVNCSECPFKVCGEIPRKCALNDIEAEAIVQKWMNEHPIVTNAMKYKEIFGVYPIKESTGKYVCPPQNATKDCNIRTCDDCKTWWDEEYKETEKEVLHENH